jgi:hypothetical protein
VSWFANDWDLETAGSVAQYQDVAVVFVNSDSGEGESGSCLAFPWRFWNWELSAGFTLRLHYRGRK